jgi:hypothetical protein
MYVKMAVQLLETRFQNICMSTGFPSLEYITGRGSLNIFGISFSVNVPIRPISLKTLTVYYCKILVDSVMIFPYRIKPTCVFPLAYSSGALRNKPAPADCSGYRSSTNKFVWTRRRGGYFEGVIFHTLKKLGYTVRKGHH